MSKANNIEESNSNDQLCKYSVNYFSDTMMRMPKMLKEMMAPVYYKA